MSTNLPDQPSAGANAGQTNPKATDPESARNAGINQIRKALQGLRYGSVLAIVQDGIVVQIERTEKTRLVNKRL